MNGTMEYKGYYTKVQYSDEDEILFGIVQGINDVITFEGNSIEEIKNAFHKAVDDYLDMCSRYGKQPEKSYKGSFNVRISPDLHKKAALRALQLGISLNQYTELALQKCINGEFERIQNISDNLGKVASQISEKLYRSTTSMWDSFSYDTCSPMNKSLLKGVSTKQ